MKSILYTLAIMFLACLSSNLCLAAGSKAYAAYHMKTPVVDGTLTDEGWQSLPEATGFRSLSAPDVFPLQKQTFFKIGWDDEFLYIGLECQEPDIAKINPKYGDGESIWRDDSIEVFLAPKYPKYEHLIFNTAGSRNWISGSSNWMVRTSKTGKSWLAEVKIPFAELGGRPANGDNWRFNVARSIYTFDSGGEKYTTWCALSGGFNDYSNFGCLHFSSSSLSPEKARNITREEQKDVTEPLIRNITKILSRCQSDVCDIQKDCAGMPHQAAADELGRKVSELGTMQQSGSIAYRELTEMVAELYRLKDRILALEKKLLFAE